MFASSAYMFASSAVPSYTRLAEALRYQAGSAIRRCGKYLVQGLAAAAGACSLPQNMPCAGEQFLPAGAPELPVAALQ